MLALKVYLDVLKGDNEKGVLGDSGTPFKDLDAVYTKLRAAEDTKNSKLCFYCDKGAQRLTLPEYSNVHFNGVDPVMFVTPTILSDVKLEGNITCELPTTGPVGGVFITTKNIVDFFEHSTFKVVEAVPNKSISYTDITLFLNQGDLKIDTKPVVDVNRKLTFLKNVGAARSVFPDIQYQGGDLFADTPETRSTLILGNLGATSEVKVSAGRLSGYLMSSKIPNDFSLGCFNNGAVLSGVKVNLKIPVMTELLKNTLFKIPKDVPDCPKSSGNLLGAYNYNLNEGLLLHNCEFTSEILGLTLALSNSQAITKINTKLNGITFTKEVPRIKKVLGNFTLDDHFTLAYHLDTPDGCVITIPDEIDIGNTELYFRKLNPAVKVLIKAKKIHGLPGSLLMDGGKTQVIIYKHEGVFYTKNFY